MSSLEQNIIQGAPYQTPRVENNQAERRNIACAKFLAYVDQDEGIAICASCYLDDHEFIENNMPRCLIRICHFLYNTTLIMKNCVLCETMLVETRPIIECYTCTVAYQEYLEEVTEEGRPSEFIIILGPDSLPTQLLIFENSSIRLNPMCLKGKHDILKEAPYKEDLITEVPRELQYTTCVKMFSYYDQNLGIAICPRCYDEDREGIDEMLPEITQYECHYITNYDGKLDNCDFCENPIARVRRGIDCRVCNVLYVETRDEIFAIGGTDDPYEIPKFAISLGPDPLPDTLLEVRSRLEENVIQAYPNS